MKLEWKWGHYFDDDSGCSITPPYAKDENGWSIVSIDEDAWYEEDGQQMPNHPALPFLIALPDMIRLLEKYKDKDKEIQDLFETVAAEWKKAGELHDELVKFHHFINNTEGYHKKRSDNPPELEAQANAMRYRMRELGWGVDD